MRNVVSFLIVACLAGTAQATIINVPTDQPTIQAGIDAAIANDTVLISPGTYAENIIINKSIAVMGSGESLTTLYPDFSDVGPDGAPSFGNSQIAVVSAHNVTIANITLDGDNPSLAGGTLVNGANVDARNGIIEADGPWNGTVVHNTTVKNIYLRGIYARSGGAGFIIRENTVTNVAGSTSSIAIMAWMASGSIASNNVSQATDAIAANHSRGIRFADNTVTNSGSGVHSDNNNSQGGGFADTLSSNNVSNSTANGYGVWVFFPNGVNPLVNSNTVTNVDVGLFAWGGGATVGTTMFMNNSVDGQNRPNSVGAFVTSGGGGWPWLANVSAILRGNTLVNCSNGMAVHAETGYSASMSGWRNSIYSNIDGFWSEGGGTVVASMHSCWWGDASGPFNATTNPSGLGNSISDGIDYSPWWGGDYLATPALPWTWGVSVVSGSTIQEAIDSSASGDLIKVTAGTYHEGPQIVIDKEVRIYGGGAWIIPTAATGSSGDAKGWFLVQPSGSLELSFVTLFGMAYPINQAIRCYGRAIISNCTIKNIDFGPGTYAGVGIVAFGDQPVWVTDCRFQDIGRIGVLFYGAGMREGTFENNLYQGKGVGDWLDYAVEVGAGAFARIAGNSIFMCSGTASVDGSKSAGVLVTTYYGPGTGAALCGNRIMGCTSGLAAGYDAADASQIAVACGSDFIENEYGISTVAAPALKLNVYDNYFSNTVNAEDNTGSSTWDNTAGSPIGNCWADWATNPGYPTTYHVAGTANAVDHFPNTNCGSDCCVQVTGNVNTLGIVDLVDLSALVNYLTGGGYVLPCESEANVNKAGIVDLADLSALVNYLTGGGYQLPSCL